ncbi:Mu transposase-like protein [Kitasatospora sp. SolWspMP-SS2h]|uniref:Mu transposase C-terminal domain-containing protein n=1 Tax=Kitasatospora sp. SolWspMP-SS2h TaxID=1305729 RepID=UPI000DBA3A99|nr:Mu transposase C-terminal domain-containing protein [Kitasatospora sp. SolWspMP-SS2h]RAJ29270.1 Mu transposase-like protein [Kitasatospora sp. SolWspMP-SS2h]
MNAFTFDDTDAAALVPAQAEPALDAVSLKVLRAPAVRRLLALRAEGALTRAHVRTTAQCLAVSDRTVWRWLAEAADTPATVEAPGERRADRFEITPQIRVLLAYWRGNASAVHRELLAHAHPTATPAPTAAHGTTTPDGATFDNAAPTTTASAVSHDATTLLDGTGTGSTASTLAFTPDTALTTATFDAAATGDAVDAALPSPSTPCTLNPACTAGTVIPGGAPAAAVPALTRVPSLATFLRAVRRDLTPGELAGYRKGPEAARALDVFGKRPRTWRNHTWEGDHVQAPLRVTAGGRLVRPHVTWFIDCATKVITGVAVTPGVPSRASILVALRSAILRTGAYGPVGGRPETVRIDRGKDFLSATVTAAFDAFGTAVDDLPAYSPHLKGSIENLNRSAARMLFAALPAHRAKQPRRRPDRLTTAPAMSFEDFTAEVLAFVTWWNTQHHPDGLQGRTPLEAWNEDPTPLTDIPQADLWSFTLEDDARTRRITSHGVRFKSRDYLADWMTGQAGREVRVRFMPHHTHEIEVCDPAGRRLGTAHLADHATPEQLTALRQARARRAGRLRTEAKAAEQLRHQRFAPTTTSATARLLDAVTAPEATRELSRHHESSLSALALPDLIPPTPAPPDWPTPATVRTARRPSPPPHPEDAP